jgi:hypothetical protein
MLIQASSVDYLINILGLPPKEARASVESGA